MSTPEALADEDLVKGILVNLLENAAEAARRGWQHNRPRQVHRRQRGH